MRLPNPPFPLITSVFDCIRRYTPSAHRLTLTIAQMSFQSLNRPRADTGICSEIE
jgi:hypothetical protein